MNCTKNTRNRDFMRAVRLLAASCESGAMSQKDLIAQASETPAPEFYVSYERAYRIVSQYMHGRETRTDTPTRRMWACLASRVKDEMARHPRITYARALTNVLDRGNAPAFYLSPSRAVAIYYSTMRHRHKR